MINNSYSSPKADELLLAGNATICEVSMGTEDVIVMDPIDWDWDNA